MGDDTKRIARRIIDEAFNSGRLEVADELIASGWIEHDPAIPDPVTGPEGFKRVTGGYRAAFPDLNVTIEHQCAEGDTVCTRWTARGTHQGEFWGVAPTGREVTVSGITMDRIQDGRMVESWTNWDTLGLLQQLGAVPAAAHA